MGIVMIPNGNGGLTPVGTYTAPPATCPGCGKPEKQVTICGHCNYVYPEGETTFMDYLIGAILLVIVIWVFMTLLCWMCDNGTLVEMVQAQWEWLTKLVQRIY